MHPLQIFPFVVFAVFMFFIIGPFLFRIIKKGGFKAAMFGAPIARTVGEVAATNSSQMMNVSLKVHVLGGDSADKAVGLEFLARSFASFQMMPVSLSKLEARKLIMLLESASQS